VLILLADSDSERGRLIREYLQAEGHSVDWVFGGHEALASARLAQLDLLILATQLGGLDGLEVCRRLRAESVLPIVLLGSDADVDDCIAGLELGADGYVMPPFSPRELSARVRAIFRRARDSPAQPLGEVLVLGDLRIVPLEFRATLHGRVLDLRPQEYRLLLVFARNPGVVLTRERLLEEGWNRSVNGATVGVHLAWLRGKLRGSNVRIENVRMRGYRLSVVNQTTN
jgi:two-component system alkaline phosphatase synthesis response regulator PhoP